MADALHAHSSDQPVWTWPELKRAPVAFRTFIELTARNWAHGLLEVITPDGLSIPIQGADGPTARLIVKDYRFVGRLMAGGSVGFAEGYIAGEWDTPDLPALLIAMAQNLDRLRVVIAGNFVVRTFNRLIHQFRPNTRAGAKKNIHAHYDLGNAFYEQWLDRTMTYSSALYETPKQPLDQAQTAKYRALAEAMGLKPGHKVLEIGCGWGGFAEFAAKEVGAEVVGITISEAQYGYARERLQKQGLNDKADIRLIDYRDVQGQFDRIASIEMFEAVGEEYWPAYFGKIHEVLRPGGRAGLQIITIRDDLFEGYRSRADFIQRYVFPGGVLPSERRLLEETDRAGLGWGNIRRFGQNYADTLHQWADRFQAKWDTIAPLGFDERFRRLWQYYLSYCEAGFRTGRTDVIQLELTRA